MPMHASDAILTASVGTSEAAIFTVASVNFTANEPDCQALFAQVLANVTASATGNTLTLRLRQGNGTTGTLVATSSAFPFLTGVLTLPISWVAKDNSSFATVGNPAVYTVTGQASAGTMAINNGALMITPHTGAQ